ncbi:MAG: type II secretion system F family protein [Phycisphaerales bacterium]|nr:type II secretion system F family protein [Phycisphaerales bacterium]
MTSILLPSIIALAVALATYAVAQLMTAGADDKRKLKQRLVTQTRSESVYSRQSVVLQTDERGLASWPMFVNLNRQLSIAYPNMSMERFILQAIGLGILLALLIGGLSASLMVMVVALGFGFYVPFFILGTKRAKRQRMMANQLPEALDFLSRVLRAGHSLSTGLQMMGEELPQPIAAEFTRCYHQHSLGQPMEECLKEMSRRVDSTDFAFFVTAVLIQRQTGGDLCEVLDNISGMIRQRIRLQANVKAKTAEGRFTGYILVAFPLVMFLVSNALNPEYAGVLTRTPTGLMMLGVTAVMLILGLFMIKKITVVRV